MDGFLKQPEPKKGINKIFVLGLIAGIAVVAVVLIMVSMKPSTQQIQVAALEGAFLEGSPEFEKYTKKIVCETDLDNTQQSPTGLGTIMMSIRGKIRNITGKTLTGLELKVGVIDTFGNMVKEKTVVVIPKEVERLEHSGVMPVQVVIEGFNKDDDRANIRWKVTAIKVAD